MNAIKPAVTVRKVLGFTLVELLVVLAIIGTLLSLVAPRYIGNVERAKEATLKQNLATLRDAIDKHYGDKGIYPNSLSDLVAEKYLRQIPWDPITDSNASWKTIPSENAQFGGVADVRSGATGAARDGSRFQDW